MLHSPPRAKAGAGCRQPLRRCGGLLASLLLVVALAGCDWQTRGADANPAVLAATVRADSTPAVMPAVVDSAAAGAPRAIWVWETETFNLLDREAGWAGTFAFLDRHRIAILYLYADEYRGRNILVAEPEKYRRLITAVHQRGGKVYALLGSYYLNTPEYILPEKRAVAVRMFARVLDYNAASDTAARFDGVNIDIEPYLLDDWREKLALRAGQYLELSAEFMRLTRASGDTLVVGPAMPFWFDGIEDIAWRGQRRRLSEHAQDIYDYVALMDYRNYAAGRDSIISHAADEIAYADRTGKHVVIGVETLRSEPRKVTFYGMGYAAMEAQLAIAEREFAPHPAFAGFAIHHLGSYLVMTDSRTEHVQP